MEEWRNIAIAEVNELCYLLREGPSFTKADLYDHEVSLGNRLHGLLECIKLDPTQAPHIEDDSMSLTTREDLIQRIGICCTHLDFDRLRRVAMSAYEEVQNQRRAIALQAQTVHDVFPAGNLFWVADDDTPTAADPGDGIGAEPDCVVYAPGQS